MPDKRDPPAEVAKIRHEITEFFKTEDAQGRRIGRAHCGVYAFYDYELEPIYVGQTIEGLSGRVSRHLTGRRSDAVAKFVLDPFEVLEIEVWPMFDLQGRPKPQRKDPVNRAEYAVYRKAIAGSRFAAVLNEGEIKPARRIKLPPSFRARIIPDDLYEERRHPDVRLARRARTMANLAQLISERVIRRGLRTTLHVQAQRLELLARTRLADFVGDAQGDELDDD